jgi:hypothetical protein
MRGVALTQRGNERNLTMTDTNGGNSSGSDEPTGEEREQIAQEGRLQQTEEEESQEDD